MASQTFILASSSPRRLDLLSQLGLVPAAVIPADIDEAPHKAELPIPYANRMAREKAVAVAALHPDRIILAADTVVAVGRRILPKGETPAMVRDCLTLLSGRRHHVLTAVALQVPGAKLRVRLCDTVVRVNRLTAAQIDAYVECGQGIGCAGGYRIQGGFASHVPFISGSQSGIVGLPLFETAQLLRAAGVL